MRCKLRLEPPITFWSIARNALSRRRNVGNFGHHERRANELAPARSSIATGASICVVVALSAHEYRALMPRRTSLEVKFGAKVKLGPIMELAKSLHAQGEAAFSAGDEYGGLALMRQAVDVLEQSSGQPGFNAEAHLLLCSIRSDVGDALRKLARWGEARAHLERVLIEAADVLSGDMDEVSSCT